MKNKKPAKMKAQKAIKEKPYKSIMTAEDYRRVDEARRRHRRLINYYL